MTLILCIHPLSEKFKAAIEAELAPKASYIALSAVKAKGNIGGLRYLSQQQCDSVFVVYEEADERVLLPIVCLLSLFVRARRRMVVDPGLAVTPIDPPNVLRYIGSVLMGSLAAAWSGIIAALELKGLDGGANPQARFRPNSRILYLNTNISLGVKAGGSLGHIAGVVNELYERRGNVLYAATRRFSVISPDVPMEKLELPPFLGIPMDLFLFGFSQRSYRQLTKHVASGPVMIYQRMSRSDYTGAKLSRKHGVPLVMEYNGSEVWGARHWGQRILFERLARKAELASLRSAHLVVTISDVLADELVETGIERSRIVVYPNCVDSSVFDPARFSRETQATIRARHGIPADAMVLGFIGTFGRWHGVDVFCEAIRHLAQDRREWLDRWKVRFLIIGDGHQGYLVDQLVRDNLLQKYVVWPGLVEQPEAPAYLSVMDILLSPHVQNPDGSKFFGSPTKLFEYMSIARPIIASRLEQIGKVLSPALSAAALPADDPGPDSAELAVLAEPGNGRELATAIQFMVERSAWRDVLARNARQEVLRKYQWSHHVDQIFAGISALPSADARLPGAVPGSQLANQIE